MSQLPGPVLRLPPRHAPLCCRLPHTPPASIPIYHDRGRVQAPLAGSQALVPPIYKIIRSLRTLPQSPSGPQGPARALPCCVFIFSLPGLCILRLTVTLSAAPRQFFASVGPTGHAFLPALLRGRRGEHDSDHPIPGPLCKKGGWSSIWILADIRTIS